jgi:ATP-dependent DNA helicase RecG
LAQEERLANAISDAIAPFILPDIEIKTYQQKEIILIHIPHLPGPFYVKKDGPEDGVYVRIGSTSRVADAEMLQNLRLLAKKISFDETPHPRATKDDLDWNVIKKAFSLVGKKITEHKAENLGLLVRHAGKTCPSSGGIILFGLNRLQTFPDAIIKCVRFIGTNKAQILDHLTITTYPIFALEEALNSKKGKPLV